MQIDHPTILTPGDHEQLERLMCTLTGSRAPYADLVRRKLAAAVILRPEEAADDLVASGRKVRFSVNGAAPADGRLTWERQGGHAGSALSLHEPLGLALLGLRAGQSISVPVEGGIGTVEVIGVTVPENGQSGATAGASRAMAAKGRRGTLLASLSQHLHRALTRIQKGRTEAALMRLSDADLRDIGITRGEISHVAGIVAGPAPPPSVPAARQDRQASVYARGVDDVARPSGRWPRSTRVDEDGPVALS